jgi:hypothetical protein
MELSIAEYSGDAAWSSGQIGGQPEAGYVLVSRQLKLMADGGFN